MRKISYQNIFCFLSILFIGTCCIFYGSRFIKLHFENEKVVSKSKNSLAEKIANNNKNNNNYKQINNEYYFIGNAENNYLEYSNILWRIIKINKNNEILAISDSSLTSLAYGNTEFKKSYINKWLNNIENDEYSGILEKVLNNKEELLIKTTTCLDKVKTIDNSECKEKSIDTYMSLLSTKDYANIGKESYLINKEYFYLINQNEEDKIWQITNDGKIISSLGTDIIGVRPTITLKSNLTYLAGNGKKDDPYIIEEQRGLFGSYVKLDKDIWRIYEVNDKEVRLVLNDYIKINNKNLTYKYSNINSYHNDTKNGSIAYYLNKTFLNSLSYKNKIKEVKWSNGYYGSETKYDYKEALSNKVDSKVALISMGNIILNNELKDYYTMTGSIKNGTMVYAINENKKLFTKYIGTELNVVPVISIEKDLLTEGNGTINSPYEME